MVRGDLGQVGALRVQRRLSGEWRWRGRVCPGLVAGGRERCLGNPLGFVAIRALGCVARQHPQAHEYTQTGNVSLSPAKPGVEPALGLQRLGRWAPEGNRHGLRRQGLARTSIYGDAYWEFCPGGPPPPRTVDHLVKVTGQQMVKYLSPTIQPGNTYIAL